MIPSLTPDFSGQPRGFLVVGLGASAGGIQALREFFEHVPADSNMAYVVILHLSPNHDSKLAEVLQSVSAIPVTQVQEKVAIEPNRVFVVSPDQHLLLEDGVIVPLPNLRVEERRAPVDIFFRSLADAYGARAVSVVLSGTGANGSMGMKRIKEMGGVSYVQNPREAEFNEMPRNSIATDLVDEVLPVAEIPGRILAYRNSLGTVEIPEEAENRPELQQQALREVFTYLRLRTGHDFTNYKRATLLRRIERRINVRGLPDLPNYAAYLQLHLEECQALLKDLLISVTNFFRDKKPFAALEQDVLPAIFNRKTADSEVRIWVAGCATGEEAYSVAMLVADRTWGVLDAPKVQIFATDIDETAIMTAREGLYTLNDAADVSPERLQRYFTKEGDHYRVQRGIREMILFANHNFLKDPPFSRLDLITCRNVLIYLNSTAQERVMETFHFALRPGSFLFLGTAESADSASDLYAVVSREHHIYQARQTTAHNYPVPESLPAVQVRQPVPLKLLDPGSPPPSRLSFGELHQKLLEQYAPPSLVVNEDYDIIHLSEKAGSFLEFSSGEPTKNLLKLIRPELRLELRSALYQAVQRQTALEARNIPWTRNGERQAVTIHVRPVSKEGDPAKGFVLVVFEPSEQVPEQAGDAVVFTSDEPVAKQLEEELIQLKAQLRYSAEQYEYQAEELKASNEELQAINEELRSAAEELETSKEELQSINEELRTVNQELKVKIEEISVTSNNFQNLINSAGVATIFLDRTFCIRLYTPAALQLFNLIPSDHGRPVSDITHRLAYDELLRDAETVLDKLSQLEREVSTTDGRAFMMRVLPYRTADDRINGVVITFFDITLRKQAEDARRQSEASYTALFAASPVPFMVVAPNAPDFTITAANDAYFATTYSTPAMLIGQRMLDVFTVDPTQPGRSGSEAVASSVARVLATKQTDVMPRIRYDLVRPTGELEPRWWLAINAPLLDAAGEVSAIIHQATNVTAQYYAEVAEQERQQHQAFLLKMADALRAEPDAEAVAVRALQLLSEQLDLDRCYVAKYHLGADHADIPHQVGNDRVRPLPASGIRFSDFPEALRVTFDRTLVIDDVAETAGPSATDRRSIGALGPRALVAATLRQGPHQPYWVLVAVSATPRHWTPGEVGLLEEVAERTWVAMEHARTETALHDFSGQLEQQVAERTAQLHESTLSLQQSLAKLHQAEEAAKMGSWEYDVASGTLSWSAGMYRLFGLPAGSPVGPETYLEYVVEEERPLAERLVQQLRQEHGPVDATLRLRLAEQLRIFRIKSVVLRDDQGQPLKLVGIDLDVSEIKRLEEENLQMRLNQQKALLLGILDAQEEERRRIAESLHNGVGQLLYATKLNLERVAQLLPKEATNGTEELLAEAIRETRRVSHELVPISLQDFGLANAIEDVCRKYGQAAFQTTCEVVGLDDRLESYLEVALYRICQELLTNVAKHAQATRADILLVREDGEITLKVRDDGRGFNPKSVKSEGIGLRTIKDRVHLLNGTFAIETPTAGQGTQVTVRLPSAEGDSVATLG